MREQHRVEEEQMRLKEQAAAEKQAAAAAEKQAAADAEKQAAADAAPADDTATGEQNVHQKRMSEEAAALAQSVNTATGAAGENIPEFQAGGGGGSQGQSSAAFRDQEAQMLAAAPLLSVLTMTGKAPTL